MKAYTSRSRYDERRRFTAVFHQMGRVNLDADVNEQAELVRTDVRRRSGDLAEGSPDDGFRVTDTHLLDAIRSTRGWEGVLLEPGDDRVIPPELTLCRRDPDTLPHVIRVRGHTQIWRELPRAINLNRVHGGPGVDPFPASAIEFVVRFDRPPTDDETVSVRAMLIDTEGVHHEVSAGLVNLPEGWMRIVVPRADFDGLPTTPRPGLDALNIRGWGLTGLPPRAETYIDALEARAPGLSDDNFVLRGGPGGIANAGRMYVHGLRSFIERDWRYQSQPDLPLPPALETPVDPETGYHLVWLDVWEGEVVQFQDTFLREPALDGDDTTFRRRKFSQVRLKPMNPGDSEQLPTPLGHGEITTNVPLGALPDRYPREVFDECRDRCLYDLNLSTGEGYRGKENAHVRVEMLRGGADPVVAWSRNNAATVVPLSQPAAATSTTVVVDSADAARFRAGDLVVIEDRHSRLDPDGPRSLVIRQLLSVDTAMGILAFHESPRNLTEDPASLDVGGPLGRAFALSDHAAIRRWDGVDWLLRDVRYNLVDGITFAFSGDDFRTNEYWTFTARIDHPDGESYGFVDPLVEERVHGPRHERAPLARIHWSGGQRRFDDLRVRFMPLHDVRDRLIELGQRNLAPGAFTVVVGDGVRTFGDVDQDLEEGVTGDEAIQAALDRLGPFGGTIYIRAGTYVLEHTVLLQGRSDVRILGDGDASQLRVTGAGGAFYLDWCGQHGDVSIELLELIEAPDEETPIGEEALVADLEASLEASLGGAGGAEAFALADLQATGMTVDELLLAMGTKISELAPGKGRASASLVKTILRLRALQRANPGSVLEDIAADELAILRALPHGVVTVADSERVRLSRLTLRSREMVDEEGGGVVGAGVFITGTCGDVQITDNRVYAASGVVAASLAGHLAPSAIANRPRAGLFVRSLSIEDNHLRGRRAGASFGVRIADGVLSGVRVASNRIDGYPQGIVMEDQAEARLGETIDRTVIRDNQVSGASEFGIAVRGDGADIEANEVALAQGTTFVQAAIRVTGVSNRVRDNWIALPESGDAPLLGLIAGIVVGAGLDQGGVAARSVSDLEVVDNRIEGRGAPTRAEGILVGGPQAVYDVRITGNVVRNLGGAGIRCWGHSGAVGGLRIESNRVEGVAKAYLSWNEAVRAELRVLATDAGGANLVGEAQTPRDALAALLGQATDQVRCALEATLCWLERAALRGGIALSLVEESTVRNNGIKEIGVQTLPPGFVSPGTDVQTAGVAVTGGRDLVVQDNEVERVYGAVERQVGDDDSGDDTMLAIVDYMKALALKDGAEGLSANQTHGAIVSVRKMAAEYALANAKIRQKIGSSIYGAMLSVQATLEDQGPEARALAKELAVGISEMQEAQGYESHTKAANIVRATLSGAARNTAWHSEVGTTWDLAARFDHAILAEKEALLVEVARDVGDRAQDVLMGLEDLNLKLESAVQEVLAAPGDSVRSLRLARQLGLAAEGRQRADEIRSGLTGADLGADDRTVVDGLVEVITRALGELSTDVDALNFKELRGLKEPMKLVVGLLEKVNKELANTLEIAFAKVFAGKGEVAEDALARLRKVLAQVLAYVNGTDETGVPVDSDGVKDQDGRQKLDVVVLTVQNVDKRLAGLAAESSKVAEHQLRMIRQQLKQLANLVSHIPELQRRVKTVDELLSGALEDAELRPQYLTKARSQLAEIVAYGKEVGATLGKDTTTAKTLAMWRRLSGMGQMLLEMRPRRDAGVRDEGLGVFEAHLARALEEIEANTYRKQVTRSEALNSHEVLITGPGPAAEAAAWFTLAEHLDSVASIVAESKGAAKNDRAVAVATGVLRYALDPDRDEAEKLKVIRIWVKTKSTGLSKSLAGKLSTASSSTRVLVLVAQILSRLTGVMLTAAGRGTLIRPIAPHPAEGLYAVGVEGHLDFCENRIESSRMGMMVSSFEHHALAPIVDEPSLVLSADANTIVGASIGGLGVVLKSGTASVSVSENHLFACCGAANPHLTPQGQAVIGVSGRGELRMGGNRLHDNGTDDSGGLLHEIMVMWEGDASLQKNRVRHAGGGAGGAGILLLTELVDPKLVARLCREPSLDVEAAPTIGDSVGGSTSYTPNDVLLAGLGAQTALLNNTTSWQVGSLKLNTQVAQPSYGVLDAGITRQADVSLAKNYAAEWLAPKPSAVFTPLLGFLGRLWLYKPFFWIPQVRRSIQIGSNDVVAAGPALLVLGNAGTLVSATVVGNDFESTEPTGAVYLRHVDTTVFSSNRCECLEEVNVSVVLARRSLVSITGNTVAGAEPAAPPKPPTPQPSPDKGLLQKGGLHLMFNVGQGSSMTMELDARAVLGAIEFSQDTAYAKASFEGQESWALLNQNQIGFSESFSLWTQLLRLGAAAPKPAKAAEAEPALMGPGAEERAPEEVAEHPESAEEAQPEVAALAEYMTARKKRGSPTGFYVRTASSKSLSEVANIEGGVVGSDLFDVVLESDMTEVGKLYSLAKVAGYSDEEADQFMVAHLAKAAGDTAGALKKGIASITGVGVESPQVVAQISTTRLMEKVVQTVLRDKKFYPELKVFEALPARVLPDPRDHSLVVIGGSRVGAVNNVTTAGVHIHNADQSIENNL